MTVLHLPLALLFSSIGAGEWLLVALIALIVFGPNRLPGIMRSLGRWIGKLNQAADQFQREIKQSDLQVEDDYPTDEELAMEDSKAEPAPSDDKGPS